MKTPYNEDSLSVFEDYYRLKNPALGSSSSFYLVEKTLVLGVLFREWFASVMAANQAHRDATAGDAGIITIFKNYKDFRVFMQHEDLLTGPEANIFAANKVFLEYFIARETPLTPREPEFEKYFIQAREDVNEAIKAYWITEGYQAYCQHIAQANVKLTFDDVSPVLMSLGQPLIIYNRQGDTQLSIPGDGEKMEVTFDPLAGHYHLLRTAVTTDVLEGYKVSFEQYKIDRTALLKIEGNIAEAERKDSLLVAAICPIGHFDKAPFFLLKEKIIEMKQFVEKNKLGRDALAEVDEIDTNPKDSDPSYNFLLRLGSHRSPTLNMAVLASTMALAGIVIFNTKPRVKALIGLGVFTAGASYLLFNNNKKQDGSLQDGDESSVKPTV